MKRLAIFLSLMFALLPLQLNAETEWTADNIPIPYLSDNTKYLSNPEGIISQGAADTINAVLRQLEDSTGIQTVMVVVGHVQDGDVQGFCNDLFAKYGIGLKGASTGLVITLATEDRKYFIAPGRGLEAYLTDAQCGEIGRRVIKPYAANGNWDAAMVNTAVAVEQCALAPGELFNPGSDDDDAADAAFWIFLVSSMGLTAAAAFIRERKDCPYCNKKRGMRKVNMERVWLSDLEVEKARKKQEEEEAPQAEIPKKEDEKIELPPEGEKIKLPNSTKEAEEAAAIALGEEPKHEYATPQQRMRAQAAEILGIDLGTDENELPMDVEDELPTESEDKAPKSAKEQYLDKLRNKKRERLRITWKCKECGRTHVVYQNVPKYTSGASNNGSGPIIIIGGGGGGGYHGPIGGSFGGGSYGGGGAGGSF